MIFKLKMIALCLTLSSCVIVQTLPERQVVPEAAVPVARVILEQRAAQPAPISKPYGAATPPYGGS
jgi:hypothetical protein